MSNVNEVTIRRATSDDFDAIMQMPLVYSGHDYLPFVLRGWLADSQRVSLIALDADGSTVIGFDSVVTLDEGGKTIISQALRVHPAHRGKRVSSILQRAIAQVVAESGALRMRISTYRENTVSLNQHLALGFTLLRDEFFGPFGAVEPLRRNVDGLRRLAANVRVSEVASDDHAIGFPPALEFGITDWIPFDPTPAGIASVNRFSLAPIRFVVSEREDGSRIYSHQQVSRAGRELYASIYEPEHFFAHMLHHVETALSIPTITYVAFHCHKSCMEHWPADHPGHAVLAAAFERDEFNATFTEVVVLERAIIKEPASADQPQQQQQQQQGQLSSPAQ
jgi:GNAT superfamily N-acetyltransferase